MAKSEKELGALHVLLADTYKQLISEMVETGEVNAQLLNSLRQFLKDNEIMCDRATADEMAKSFSDILSRANDLDSVGELIQ